MKFLPSLLLLSSVAIISCKQTKQTEPTMVEQVSDFAQELNEKEKAELKAADMPILPVVPGDKWVYQVKIQVPEGAQVTGAKAIDQTFERTRTFRGKVKPGGEHPETDCFEIEAVGSPVEREYVQIDEETVKLCGSEYVGSTKMIPFWLDPAVTLVAAGVKAGESLPPIDIKDPRTGVQFLRVIQIVGRETITAAGRDFATIRILMTGKDGKDGTMDSRRTIWFAPHYGIVKEEKARYINDELIMKEVIELKSMQMKNDRAASGQ
jgi:hypothetical protein